MQQLLPVVSKDFMAELVKTFLAADIPLHKLCNLHVIQLLKNLSQEMPSETVCRDYVKTLTNNKQDHLKYLLKDKHTFIVINESEVDNTKFVNVIVETLMCWRKHISLNAVLLRLWTKASSAWR